MFKKCKNQKGFSLIELLVVVVIIAILAAIAVPIYMNYVRKARSTEAQSAIAAIRSAYRVHYQTYGTTDDYDIEDAMKDTQLGNRTLKNWEFEVVGNPPDKYIATSTDEFPEKAGKQVWYDRDDATYHGYGIDEEVDQEEVVD
ncbi:MAG: prepilin-type N-terminal cleavage/methylation domain-containing protein [Candidatus Cloacimonetes bacterium]|nr:prepilin-type N-terminal cleavage/methylation domain-containing protein [Candidatus Cloacimonadota bacterium]MCF7814149.1 prepilin-type N-terminal cleavage/methylation domain-containing protein [Candidatus Cloacimonadota bacterium]MCF7868752.1 prepilin-type N-terminal cleavage/methylation domain-containing protein [Candidatus Cloacimonadota bacterium]MCF7884148.1 prepilin-type N-terminal cleavage/methylation domain-containing protein [Candidatus Cloacimonadota bacterium]